MSDHYIAYMESEIRSLRLERDLLQARVAQQAAEVERLKAQVQRVREVCDESPLVWLDPAHVVGEIKVALDGGSDGGSDE